MGRGRGRRGAGARGSPLSSAGRAAAEAPLAPAPAGARRSTWPHRCRPRPARAAGRKGGAGPRRRSAAAGSVRGLGRRRAGGGGTAPRWRDRWGLGSGRLAGWVCHSRHLPPTTCLPPAPAPLLFPSGSPRPCFSTASRPAAPPLRPRGSSCGGCRGRRAAPPSGPEPRRPAAGGLGSCPFAVVLTRVCLKRSDLLVLWVLLLAAPRG